VKVTILAVGKPKGPLAGPIAEYEARAGRYWKLDTAAVAAGAGRSAAGHPVRDAEGERLLGRLPGAGQVVALTREGQSMSSDELARYLEERAVRSTPAVTFVLGGAFGLSSSVLDRAHRRLSLSPMTLPHDLARLVLAEQLYRAGTILRNEPYHKGTGR
jgi:23S rRNA (pseudouridine1915-N3)-methyltransferase